jgi:hypothetical protein
MRWAIKKEQGGDASGTELIGRVEEHNKTSSVPKRGSNRKRCYIALNLLARLGEHKPGTNKFNKDQDPGSNSPD